MGEENIHAKHHDDRFEEARNEYGEIAELKLEEVRERAEQAGIQNARSKTKDELMQELSKR